MRLLLVDDHPMIFDALKIILERLPEHTSTEFLPDFGEAMVRLGNDPAIDLLLLDLNLPGFTGTDALAYVCRQYPNLSVAVLSANEDRDVIDQCIDLGACGYLSKALDSAAMLSAIRVLAQGGIYTPGDDLKVVGSDPAAALVARFGLTPRQIDVLKIMVHAKSNREIAETLGLSVNTVAVHVAAILNTLGAKNRTEAVMVAARYGLRG